MASAAAPAGASARAAHPAAADAADADLAALVDQLRPQGFTSLHKAAALLRRGQGAINVDVSHPTPQPDAPPPPPRLDEALALLAHVMRHESSPRAVGFRVESGLDPAMTLLPLLEACAGVVEVLELDLPNLDDTGAKALALHLAKCTKLRHLALCRTPLGVAGLMQLMPSLESGCPNLVHLDLSSTQLGNSYGVEQLAIKHGGLRRLVLTLNSLGRRWAAALGSGLACPNLEMLDLDGNALSDLGVTAMVVGLAKCTQLRGLRLNRNNLDDAGACALAGALASLPKLRELWLRGNGMGSKGAAAFVAGLGRPFCSELERLDLGWNRIKAEGIQALSLELAKCINLKDLNLEGNNLGQGGDPAPLVSLLGGNDKLERLGLASTRLGAEAIQAIVPGLSKCTSLQSLDLYNNPIGDKGAAALAPALESCTSLQSLHLGRCVLGPEGIKAVATGLSTCTHLSELALGENSMGVEGAAALASSLVTATALKKLDVAMCSLDDKGVRHLASLVACLPGLQDLEFTYNPFADEGARALAEQLARRRTPITVDCQGNSFGEEGLAALASVLPLLHPDAKVRCERSTLWDLAESEAPSRRAVLALMGASCGRGGASGAAGAASGFVRSDGDTALMRRVLGLMVGEML